MSRREGWSRILQAAAAAVGAAVATPPAFAQQPAANETYSLFNPMPLSRLRDMSTDRPDKTESPHTVDAGRFQIETDLVVFTRDREARIETRTTEILPFNFKIGLTSSTDLQIVYGGYTHSRTATAHESGFGDITLRLKRNLWGNDGGPTALAVMPFVKIPANTLADLNDEVEGGVIVPLAVGLGSGVGLGLMTEIDLLRSDAGGYEPSFINSATVSFELTDRVGLYVEAFSEVSADGSRAVVTIDGGVTVAITDNIQLDAGANVGVTDAADDLAVFVGFSQRY
jgi:hypothetical protein